MRRVVVHPEKVCSTFIERAFGQMFLLKPRTTLFIYPREQPRAVHMLFVFFPLDVYWLNQDKRVVYKMTLYPFSFSGIHRAHAVLETSRGLFTLNVGDEVHFR